MFLSYCLEDPSYGIDYVVCPECGESSMRDISSHITRTHKTTYDNLKDKYGTFVRRSTNNRKVFEQMIHIQDSKVDGVINFTKLKSIDSDYGVEYTVCPHPECEMQCKTAIDRHCRVTHGHKPEYYIENYPDIVINTNKKEYLVTETDYNFSLEESKKDPAYGNDYIICPVCGKQYSILTRTHLKKHGIEHIEDFKIEYPEVPYTTSKFNRKMKVINQDNVNRALSDPTKRSNMLGFRHRSVFYTNRAGIRFSLISMYEVMFAFTCDYLNIEYNHCPDPIEYQRRGSTHRYYPDFLIDGVYYEIKALNRYRKTDEHRKMEKVVESNPELPIIIYGDPQLFKFSVIGHKQLCNHPKVKGNKELSFDMILKSFKLSLPEYSHPYLVTTKDSSTLMYGITPSI